MSASEMSEREILMAALASAMEASLTGNPQALLAPGALAEARRLGELIGGHHSRDAEAVMLLAAFHMHRWQCLPAGEDAWDEAQLGTWLSIAAAIDPRLVPPPLRAMAGRATPAGPGTDIHSLNAEAAALAMAFDETGEVGLLDRAIGLWRSALGQVRPEQVAPRAGLLIGLSGGLASRAEHGNMADADEAIACADEAIACAAEAVQLTPPGHDHHATALARLAVAHKSRFLLAGDRDDLTRAIAAARDTVADEYLTHLARVKNLANLADMLRISFESCGQLADLDEAVALNGQARRGAAPDEAAVIQGNLCGVLLLRFDWTQDPADIEEAVRLARIAVATAPRGHPALAGWLCNLSGALQSRAGLPGRLADIIEAISVARQAVAAAPGSHPARVMCLHTLAGALRLRIGLGDVLGVASAERDKDLTEAIELLRAACDAAPAPHPDAAYYLNALSILLRMRGGGADLDEAVTTAAAAVAATPDGQQNWCPHLSNLGNASEARFKLTRRREDYLAAMDAWRAAAASSAGESQVRLAAAIAWGRLAAAENDTAAAADGFCYAVSLLPIVAWRGLEWTAREENLARWAGLAGDAAAWAIRDGTPERAVEVLEQGRSVLWTQQLHLRTDLDKLTSVNPGLKEELDRIRLALDAPGRHRETAGSRLSSGYEQAAAKQRRDAEQWDSLVGQARELIGDDFLAPISFDRLREAAAHGPVVIVNTSSYGCDALAVHSGGVLPIPLPELDYDEITSRTKSMLAALNERDFTLNETLNGLLGWLWRTVAGPVLDALNVTGRLDLDGEGAARTRRLWWCPTGLLSFLPLHAAGLYDQDQAAVPERVIASYTSNLSLLIRARRPRAAGPRRPLLVGVPAAPGATRLLKVPDEIRRTRERMAAATGLAAATVLEGADATRDKVLREMRTHDWVHLACHGRQDVNDPAAGAIVLSDKPLPILDIAGEHLPDPDFAFLSACHTLTGVLSLADEAIHLASAFQVAGYRHVIATLWWISDPRAPDVADSVYQQLCRDGAADPDRAAEAIHLATAAQRKTYPGHPWLWAAYAHLGP